MGPLVKVKRMIKELILNTWLITHHGKTPQKTVCHFHIVIVKSGLFV